MQISDETEKLGRFGHHPDPAVDFCVEVECLENEIGNRLSGFLNGTPPMNELRERLARAMAFRVGGDEGAVYAKGRLRDLDDRVTAALSLPVQPVAWRDVIAERKRQVEKENWTPEHDDIHYTGDMARAASCYAYEATRTEEQRQQDVGNAPPLWPWDECWWKPTDPRRDLVKAGALILAEIERLDRASALTPSVQP